MKKRWVKRLCNAGLALLLVTGLCACAGSAEKTGTGGENRDSTSADSGAHAVNDKDSADIPGNVNTNTKSALAKENVYRISEVEIPDSDNVNVESIAHFDGRIYVLMKIYDWENGHKYFVLSMDESGNALQTVFLDLPGYGEEGEKAADPDPNVWELEETYYSDFVFGPDGRTFALRRYEYSYVNYFTGQSIDEQHRYVCCWDTDGSLLWQIEPCEDDREDLEVWDIFPAADGSLELLLTGEEAYRLSVGKDGSLSASDKERLSEATIKALRSCRRLIHGKDGSCLLLCRDAEWDLSLMKYDLQTDTLGEACRLPDDHLSAASLSGVVFSAGTGSDLVYADKTGVFTYDMGDAQCNLKMDYVNSDRNITDTFSLLELDETHFAMFYREDYIDEMKAGIFEYVKPEDIPDKEVVILGGTYINGGMKKRAIQYNRESDKYRIVLKEYGSCEELNLDMVSGNMPDILMADGLPVRSYIAKGLIADVGMLIEEDEELSRTEFLENVFDAYSVNGKLMYVVPSFTLSTMAAKSSLVGDGSGWTMEKMKEVLDGMGGNARLLDGLSRSDFMEQVMKYRGNDFIDLDTGKCAFDSQEFIEMMKFAYTLPEEEIWVGESGEGEYERQYLKNRTLLLELYVWTFMQDVDERICYQLNGYLGGDYTFVGFPAGSEEAAKRGSGAFVCAQNLMALSAVSENRDGAWDFARYYLTDEYQKGLETSLPVLRRIFEEWAVEETLRPYYIDENGEKVEYDEYIQSQDGKAVVVPPLDQEQLEQLIAYVESVTATPYEDSNVLNIIEEELGGFYSGQRTAEDVAVVIQRRVQVYVQENQ